MVNCYITAMIMYLLSGEQKSPAEPDFFVSCES